MLDAARHAQILGGGDPRVSRWLGGCLLATGDIPSAISHLEESLEEAKKLPLDDSRRDGAFAAYYTIATLIENLPRPDGSPKDWTHAERTMEKDRQQRQLDHLDAFLAEAPACHWHVPSACFLRCSRWVTIVAPTSGADPVSILRAHPEKTLDAVKLFTRGQDAQAYARRYYPQSPQKTAERTEATFLMEFAVKAGVIDAVPTVPDVCAYCGGDATQLCA